MFKLLFLFFPMISFAPDNLIEKKNKWNFKTQVYPIIKREECGSCKDICHYDPRDRGGLTCAGLAMNHNQDWFVNEFNEYYEACNPHYSGKLLCDRPLFESNIKEYYFNKYAKMFSKCGKKAFPMIVDSSVLEGDIRATRHIQKISNLKVDGIFGKNTLKACQEKNFNAKKYTESRIKRFKSLADCKFFCVGWIKRAKRKLKEYNK